MINVSILGASGSIGRQSLEVIDWRFDKLRVSAMTANSDWQFLEQAARKYHPQLVAIGDEKCYSLLKVALADTPVRVVAGEEGLAEAASLPETEIVLAAISGIAGLKPLLAAIKANKQIALANKEALVAAGEIVTKLAAEKGITLRPVDSEHSAIWQSLRGEQCSEAARLILTASGGAFRDLSAEQLRVVTSQQALQHPNWRMGAKITVDCATMVNKGLEVIEAHWLFNMDYEQIDVVIHPESVVHSLVAFRDGSVKAQLGRPDMRLPIQYALLNQERAPIPAPPLDLVQAAALHFYAPDTKRFPALDTLCRAGRMGGTAPAYLNGANEVLVQAFLAKKIGFCDISDVLASLLAAYHPQNGAILDVVCAADEQGRRDAVVMMEDIRR